MISAPKSIVTLFTPDKHQFRISSQMHPDITLEDTQLQLEHSFKILGVIMDPSLSFNKHCNYLSDRIDKTNNMLKALAGSSSRTEIHQNLHTHAVDSAIQLQGNNRGLKKLQTTQPTSGGAVPANSSCCANCVEHPRPQQWGPNLQFFGHAGHADPLDGWRCCSQKRVMSRPIQVRQL